MTPLLRSRRASLVVLALVVVGAAPAYFAAHQVVKTRRFQIGSMDVHYFPELDGYRRPGRMDGPIRYPDGSVEVIDFYGRLTDRRVKIELPYHAERSPVALFLRCHRFGLEGTVALTVNGEHLGDYVFAASSYPWAGIRAVVPERVAERGPLAIELDTSGGGSPPSHLPEGLGVGLDWIDVDPMSEGAVVKPTKAMFLTLYGFVVTGFAFALAVGLALPNATLVLVTLTVLSVVSAAYFPVETPVALSWLWLVFVLAFLVHVVVTRVVSLPEREARFVSCLVAVAALAHSLLIFFPNHLPPDVPHHAIQVSWLSSVEFSYEGLTEYARALSRGVTDDGVLMGIGDAPEESDLPAASYGAPYPPFFYMLAYGLSGGGLHLRFVLEFLAVAMASLMLVVVYLVAREIWNDETVSRLAALFFAVEISVWHHANRGHAPGLFGAFFVLVFVWFLVHSKGELRSMRSVVAFALLTAAVALSYTVSLIQILLFVPILVTLRLLVPPRTTLRSVSPVLAGFGVGLAIAFASFYAPYAVDAMSGEASGEVLLSRSAEYDPPATFYFLRNQMRDSVRLLKNGHALFVLLSIVGIAFLGSSGASPYHERVVWAVITTYLALLVLKDPTFVPRVFLHAKEDLFYAPFACMLVALFAARLWASGKLGRWLVRIGLVALVMLSLRDKSWNVDTLHNQPLVRYPAPDGQRRA